MSLECARLCINLEYYDCGYANIIVLYIVLHVIKSVSISPDFIVAFNIMNFFLFENNGN